MKSKTFELSKKPTEEVIPNKTYDFINYYKPASEINDKLVDKHKLDNVGSNENSSKSNAHFSKREHLLNKKNKKFKDNSINIFKINVDGSNLPHTSGSNDDSKVTSTANVKGKKDIDENVKSIMKNSSAVEVSFDKTKVNMSKNKPKKRNKSVSFMLDDAKSVAIKKSKSELSITDSKITQNSGSNFDSIKTKKAKKKSKEGKENKEEIETLDHNNKDASKESAESEKEQAGEVKDGPAHENENKLKLDKKKRQKKPKQNENSANQEAENETKIDKIKEKKKKNKKHQAKLIKDKTDAEGEPAAILSKKVIKPEVIAQDLENLSIGDNAHTLTNLLDEMAVVDKKKKKHKKTKQNKQQNVSGTAATDDSETKGEEEKEKVKWMKRKWNKDRKGGVNDDKLVKSIVIENLPLKIMCNYRKLLTEHFTTFGSIKLVGIAEVYSIEQPQVFTTTINFESEDAAIKALEEDNTLFEGNRIRIKRPLPPSQTTLVVRSYADLSEPALSSVFTSAGRIRNVRRLVKGKKSMCTAFIEFDGPEAVERAIKMAEDVKMGGKKIFAAKFELRNKNKKLKIDKKNENEGVSEDSSD